MKKISNSLNKFRPLSLEQKFKITLNHSNNFHTVPKTVVIMPPSSLCAPIFTVTTTKIIIILRAVATNTIHDPTRVPVLSWCLTLGRLGDHAEAPFPASSQFLIKTDNSY